MSGVVAGAVADLVLLVTVGLLGDVLAVGVAVWVLLSAGRVPARQAQSGWAVGLRAGRTLSDTLARHGAPRPESPD